MCMGGPESISYLIAGLLLGAAHPSHHAHHPCSPAHHRPPRCEQVNSTRAFCSGGANGYAALPALTVRTLVLCHWPDDTLDPEELLRPDMPALRRLQITASNITELAGDFPYDDHLEELILSGLHLTWLSGTAFSQLRRLRLLDLSRNLLSSLHSSTLLQPPSLQRVMLSGNPWRCTLELTWLTLPAVHRLLADPERLLCGAALYPRKPVITVVTLLKRVSAECPAAQNCSCELTRVVRGVPAGLVPIIGVNCSARGLRQFPSRLPGNTTTLLLRSNTIKSVRPLLDKYGDVLDVYLDSNLIESVADLEGSHFLTNFRVLSLRGNKLQQLPTYALDNALERNNHAGRIYLGGNPWRCDCLFMPTFQELLAKYKPLIADLDDIRCAVVKGDDNSLRKIHSLSRSAVCRDDEEPVFTSLDLVNALLGCALAAVLLKLAYDYWQYKNYGRLPWIATKLP